MLLVSNDFQHSEYITSAEVSKAMERHAARSAIVIPIIVRPTEWRHAPYSALEALPDFGKPVSTWENADEAWLRVVQRVATVLDHADFHVDGATLVYPCVDLAPPPPSPFLGRDAFLERVSSELASSTRVVVVRGGLAGVGKSALAAFVASRERAKFLDGVLWARVDASSTQEIMSTFLDAIGAPADSSSGSLPIQYLGALARRCCLLILDNASSMSQVSPLIPRSGPSRVLVTTRYAIAADTDDSVEVALPPLPLVDATNLLRILASQDTLDSPSTWADLAQELGRLPLALRIAAGIIRELDWSAADYLKRLRQAPDLSWLDSSESGGLGACFSVNYRHLRNEQSRLIFRALGAFTESISLTELEPASGLNSDVLERSLLNLTRQGLVEVSKGSIVEIHPLVQRYAQELLREQGEAARVHVRAALWNRSSLTFWCDDTRSFSSFGSASAEDGLHGLRAATHFVQAGAIDSAQEVCEGVADAVTHKGNERALWSLLHGIRETNQLRPWLEIYWSTLVFQLHYHEWTDEARRSLRALTKTPDAKVSSAAWIALGKDAVYDDRLQDALACFNESLSLKRVLRPTDDRGIAYVLNELGRLALRTSGDTATALKLHDEALALQDSLCDRQGMGYTLRRVASIYLRYKHDAAQALTALDRAEQLAMEENFVLLWVTVLVEKAEALSRLEKFRSAADVLVSASELAKRSDNPYCEAKVLRRIGVLYERVQLYGASLSALTDAMKIFDTFDPKAAEACRRSRDRVLSIVENLRLEEGRLRRELACTEPYSRTAARRLKRIQQQLGTVPGLIRVGRD